MLKKTILACSLLGMGMTANAQVGVNTNTPASTFDIVAQNATGNTTNVDGLLIPRVDRERALNMASVPTSTLIYVDNITTGTATGQAANIDAVGYYHFSSGAWQKLVPPAPASGWALTGNAGTTPATDFIGTTDNQNVIFKRNNIQSGMITTGNTSFGNNSIPQAATGTTNTAVGSGALSALTSGTGNASVGNGSLTAVTTGNRNIGIGLNTGRGVTTGGFNVAIGGNALSSTTAAGIQRNIAIGDNALISNNGGNSNIAIGVNTGTAISSGGNNILIGDTAGGITLSNGNNNTVLGSIAGAGLTTGSNNVILGASAGSNITTGGTNIAIGNNSQIPTPTASNQMNIGNAIFGTGMTGTLAAPAGNIGIGTSTPARRLEVNAASAPIRVSNLQAIATGSPNTTVPLILDTTTGDVYQGRASEILIFNSNFIPNAAPINVDVTATPSALGNSNQSLYNTTFTLVRPALVSIFNSISTSFSTTSGGTITDGSPRISITWVRISDSSGATIIQDNMGLASASHTNSLTGASVNLTGSYYSASNPMLALPAGTYRLDIFSSVRCSSGQNVKATYGSANDNLYLRADYF